MKHKIIIEVYLLLLLGACSPGTKKVDTNYFEGKIVYKIAAQSKVSNYDVAKLLTIMGDSTAFYFKQGNFKQLYNGTERLLEETYIQKENKSYVKKSNSDSLFWYDCSTPGEK